MICPKCAAENNPGDKFCKKCGEMLGGNNFNNEFNVNNNYQPNTNYSANNMNGYTQGNFGSQQPYQTTRYYNYKMDFIDKKTNGLGLVSLILGIISILGSFFFLVSLPAGITGLILGIRSKIKDGLKKGGIVLNIIGLFLTVVFTVLILMWFVFPNSGKEPSGGSDIYTDEPEIYTDENDGYLEIVNTYYGDGFSLDYGKDWSTVVLSGGQTAFEYKNSKSYFLQLGVSALSDSLSDFDTDSGKEKLYNLFYDFWNGESENLKIYNASGGFDKLTDDIYYATYDYGSSSDRIKGKYILLVSAEKNAIISFMTNAADNNVEENDEKVIELLKNIEIYEQIGIKENTTDDNVIYDDELYNYLDSMSNWNRYAELRTGDLGKVKDINGLWRILAESEMSWKFENGEFWLYESYKDTDDNYWYGTTEIMTGKEGLLSAGLDPDKLDKMMLQSNGQVTEDDVYIIICTPTKIISDGVDKSDTNIPEGTTLDFIWVLIDHGEEGIEAQIGNITTGQIYYFVKIAD